MADVTSVGSGAIITAAERTKLTNIEVAADVTDATNVAAAGAVMNTGDETIGGAKTFSSTIVGNVSGNAGTATTASTVTTAAQPTITSVGTLTGLTVGGNATISGNLTINGSTTTIDSTVVTINDPVFEIGQSSNDDNLDRGIKYKYKTDTEKIGFFGMDDTDQKFTYIPDAIDNGSVFSGSVGTIKANIEGNLTGNATTVTNGVYTTSSVVELADVTSVGSGAIITTSERNKLNAIEASADVTDATNVAAAGAMMKSGNETIEGTKTF